MSYESSGVKDGASLEEFERAIDSLTQQIDSDINALIEIDKTKVALMNCVMHASHALAHTRSKQEVVLAAQDLMRMSRS